MTKRGSVKFNNVYKIFARKHRTPVVVFEDINFGVEPGQFVSLLGPSGCGKSTLLRMTAGLTDVTAGTVMVDGEVVDGPFGSMGMVFQEDTLLEWRTVLRNVLLVAEVKKLPLHEAKARAKDLLENVGLAEFMDAFPGQLSGGMKQRASICQALLHRPQLLLMDEPFGALDALTREQMQRDLQSLWSREGSTVLFVTHSISEAVLLSDRVIVLSNRPARILADLTVSLSRPRSENTVGTPEFLEVTQTIHSLFRREGVLR